jgi:hypothetical protein
MRRQEVASIAQLDSTRIAMVKVIVTVALAVSTKIRTFKPVAKHACPADTKSKAPRAVARHAPLVIMPLTPTKQPARSVQSEVMIPTRQIQHYQEAVINV